MQLKKQSTSSNIEILIYIGQYKLVINIPKQTKVGEVLNIVRSYQKIHQEYGPIMSHFIGLQTVDDNQLIDFWMTQSHLDLSKFKKKVTLRAIYSQRKKIDKLSISDFKFLKCLGTGACGQVYLVRNLVTGNMFAMKRFRRSKLVNLLDMEQVLREKKILSQISPSKFTINFHASFQSANYFNILIDYCPGGQLFTHLIKNNSRDQQENKLYFCQIACGLQYLHSKNILYRDLKPQNVLVDISGHLKLADFGLSKSEFKQDLSTESRVGSEQYMAPQVCFGLSGYNFAADFYSLGALLFELLTGLPPYYQAKQQSDIVKKKLMLNMIQNFDKIENQDAKDLAKRLLHPNPNQRIVDFNQIKNSEWLKDVNWKMIQNKLVPSSLAPNLYQNYIGDQFIREQFTRKVEQMNMYLQKEGGQDIYGFNEVKPQSKLIMLGQSLKQPKQHKDYKDNHSNHQISQNFSKKRIIHYPIKQKTKSVTTASSNSNNCSYSGMTHRSKGNLSINLFEKEESMNITFEPSTTRNHNQLSNKENQQKGQKDFKRKASKKLMKITSNISTSGYQTNSQSNNSASHTPTNRTLNRTVHESKQLSSRNQSTSKDKKNLNLKSDKLKQKKLNLHNNSNSVHFQSMSNNHSRNKSGMKSKSKEKSMNKNGVSGINLMKKQPSKLKKDLLPVSSYKIKLK